jgi:hypothetical protein
MEVGSPEWIEASIAKLEQLEQERATHQQAIETVKEPMALRRHTDALGRLDAEIKALYAQLEEFAEDDEEESEDEDEQAAAVATPERRTVDDETLSAPHVMAKDPVIPTPAPVVAAISSPPVSSAPAFVSSPAASVEMSAPSASYDDDVPKGGAGKWIFLGVLLVGGLGAGGFFMMNNNKAPEEKPAQAKSSRPPTSPTTPRRPRPPREPTSTALRSRTGAVLQAPPAGARPRRTTRRKRRR